MSDRLVGPPGPAVDAPVRDWVEIGVRVAAAFALVVIFAASVWALLVLLEAI